MITGINSRTYGPIVCKAIQIDNEAGFVQTSEAEIWTHVPSIAAKMGSMINIIHFHINDTSEEASIDQKWVSDKEAQLIMQDRTEDLTLNEF